MRLKAIRRLQCPHCLEGKVFSSLLKMNPDCLVCGIHFEREPGYFMMAVFFGYVLGFIVVLPLVITLYLMAVPSTQFLFTVTATLLLLSPFIFRYARVLWMHLDELLDPRP